MDDDLIEIARTWSAWDEPVPAFVRRSVDLPSALESALCLVVQGVRRSGKSTLLRQLIGHYGLDPARCVFLNLEDPRLSLSQSYVTLERLVQQFRARHGDREPLYFFLDEVQAVEGWQRWLRAQLDRPRGDVFIITGSNATMLSGELSTVLTGRHLMIELFPFDLDEVRQMKPEWSLPDYLTSGGFPEAVRVVDGERLLRQYFHDIVERDIRERLGARSSLPIRQVVQMVFEAAGSELSLRRISAAVGVSVDTVGSYLAACEAAYLLFACPWFAFSERQRASRNPKYYPVDTGLRRVVVSRTGADRGKSLECAVYLALRRRTREVYYWRDGGEVDFVACLRGRIVPVQVTWDTPLDRHERGLADFYARYPQAQEAVFVTAADFESALRIVDERLNET